MVPMSTQGSQRAASISVVINTNGRCQSLTATLEALRFQTHPAFEVCVVCGPARDGTHELVAELEAAGAIKATECPQSNLSMSRNLGIALAAGEFVAFIDDDALPEPVWLTQLLDSFDRPEVAGVSGTVLQPDGQGLQFRFSTCDRFGNARHDLDRPADAGAFPLSAHFPHVMGTNAIFRRAALVAIGGFDEEYEYYLDEADLCCRLVDAGYLIRQRCDAPVHHKFLSGTVRDGEGITVCRYPILKNQLYFSLVNGRSHASLPHILDASRAFADRHRSDVAGHVARGTLHPQTIVDFDADYDRAMADALMRGLSAVRRLPARTMFQKPPAFRPAHTASAAGVRRRRHVGLVADDAAASTGSLAAARARAERLLQGGDFARVLVLTPRCSRRRAGAELVGGAWHHFASAGEGSTGASAAALQATINCIAAYDPFDAIEDEAGILTQRRAGAHS